jgi:hypothetical protein
MTEEQKDLQPSYEPYKPGKKDPQLTFMLNPGHNQYSNIQRAAYKLAETMSFYELMVAKQKRIIARRTLALKTQKDPAVFVPKFMEEAGAIIAWASMKLDHMHEIFDKMSRNNTFVPVEPNPVNHLGVDLLAGDMAIQHVSNFKYIEKAGIDKKRPKRGYELIALWVIGYTDWSDPNGMMFLKSDARAQTLDVGSLIRLYESVSTAYTSYCIYCTQLFANRVGPYKPLSVNHFEQALNWIITFYNLSVTRHVNPYGVYYKGIRLTYDRPRAVDLIEYTDKLTKNPHIKTLMTEKFTNAFPSHKQIAIVPETETQNKVLDNGYETQQSDQFTNNSNTIQMQDVADLQRPEEPFMPEHPAKTYVAPPRRRTMLEPHEHPIDRHDPFRRYDYAQKEKEQKEREQKEREQKEKEKEQEEKEQKEKEQKEKQKQREYDRYYKY